MLAARCLQERETVRAIAGASETDEPMRPRILVCTVPEMTQLARETLAATGYDVDICLHAAQAYALLRHQPDLILCNLHFDEGNMFEFLRRVRMEPSGSRAAFVLIRTRDTMTSSQVAAICTASHALGIEHFIDTLDLRERLGHAGTQALIRHTLDSMLKRLPEPACTRSPAAGHLPSAPA